MINWIKEQREIRRQRLEQKRRAELAEEQYWQEKEEKRLREYEEQRIEQLRLYELNQKKQQLERELSKDVQNQDKKITVEDQLNELIRIQQKTNECISSVKFMIWCSFILMFVIPFIGSIIYALSQQ